MAGVASDADRRDMRVPVFVYVPRHFEHAPRHHLCVEAIVGKILDVMAITAPLLRRDPFGDRQHHTVELIGAEIGSEL